MSTNFSMFYRGSTLWWAATIVERSNSGRCTHTIRNQHTTPLPLCLQFSFESENAYFHFLLEFLLNFQCAPTRSPLKQFGRFNSTPSDFNDLPPLTPTLSNFNDVALFVLLVHPVYAASDPIQSARIVFGSDSPASTLNHSVCAD